MGGTETLAQFQKRRALETVAAALTVQQFDALKRMETGFEFALGRVNGDGVIHSRILNALKEKGFVKDRQTVWSGFASDPERFWWSITDAGREIVKTASRLRR